MSSYLRLKPLPFSSLPLNQGDLNQAEGQESKLRHFLTPILAEATTLISSTNPSSQAGQTFRPDRKLRSSAPSTAQVQLLTSAPSPTSNGKDYWVCRCSTHADSAQKGSASWAEFEHGLRENHSEHEMEYTPSVAAVEHLAQWPVLDELAGWSGVDMHVNMITHTFKPALISPRTFVSLVISAGEPATTESSEKYLQGFYTIQIPLEVKEGVPPELRARITAAVPKNTVFAHYTSVERVRLLPALTPTAAATSAEDSGKRVEWIMATTSDAGGSIPQWVQRSWTMGGVPRAVVADVGLFLGWVERRRS